MQQRNLPGTALNVSEICLGSVNFGMPTHQAESFALMDAFVAAGGNFIDSARVYCDWLPGGANISETTVGNWVKARGNRANIVLATKGAHPRLETMHIPRMSPADIREDVEASLKYLQTDVIDVYWLHRDDVSRPAGEILETLNEHIKAGELRYIGCSNWTVARILEANDYAAAHGIPGLIGNQPLWSLAEINRDAVGDQTLVIMGDEELEFHRATKMPVIPYTSQGKGFFKKLAENRVSANEAKQYDSPLNRTRYDRIRELSQRHNVSISAIVLSYLTSQPFPVVPIIGTKDMAQLTDSIEFAELRLSPDEVDYLSAKS
jgi:aryl-alcohol dehydrogenase-like predicted oxidoreductase